MPKPLVNADAWPLVFIDWEAGVTAAGIEAHFEELREIARTHSGPALPIVNLGQIDLNAVLRMKAAKGVDLVIEDLQDRLVAIAYVTTSGFARGLVTAVHWFVQRNVETRVFDNQADAASWAKIKLNEAVTGPARE